MRLEKWLWKNISAEWLKKGNTQDMKSQVFISLALSIVQAYTQMSSTLAQQRWLYKGGKMGIVFNHKKSLLPLSDAANLVWHQCCYYKDPVEESSNSLIKRRIYF